MPAEAMVEYLRSRDGVSEERAMDLVRTAVASGTSDPAVDLDQVLRSNRAGPGETTLTLAELLRLYG
jgi:hypothetical protein